MLSGQLDIYLWQHLICCIHSETNPQILIQIFFCASSGMATEVSNGDFFGENLEIWSQNDLLLWSKSPYPLKFVAFH